MKNHDQDHFIDATRYAMMAREKFKITLQKTLLKYILLGLILGLLFSLYYFNQGYILKDIYRNAEVKKINYDFIKR